MMFAIFSPPVFSDPDKSRKAAFLFKIIWGVLVIATATHLALVLSNPPSLTRAVFLLGIYWSTGLYCLILLKRGHVRGSTLQYLIFLFVLFFGAAWTGGGIRGHPIQVLPVLVLFAGITLGRRMLLLFGLIASLGGLGLVAADHFHCLPVTEAVGHTPLIYWIVTSATIALLCILETMSVGSLETALRETEKELAERKRLETELQKSHANLAALIESTTEYIWSVDLDYRLLTFNSMLADHFRNSYGTTAFVGCTTEDVLPAERAALWMPMYEKVLSHGPYMQEYQLSDTRFLELSFNPIIHDGATIGISVFGKDVTKRKLAENALRESEEFRKRVFDSSRVPIVVMDAETNSYIECNSAAAAIYHFPSREDVLGKKPLDFSARAQYDGTPSEKKIRFYIKKAIAEGSVVFEWMNRRPDGIVWDAEVHLMSFKSGNRQLLQFTLLDITDRKKNEEHLRLLNATLDVSSDGVYWMDAEGKFVYVNEAGCRSLGYSSDEMLSLHIGDINSGATPDRWKQVLGTVRTHGNYTSEAVHRRKDGSTFPVEIVSAYIKFGDKEYINGFARDITERKKAEAALIESEERYRRLLESVTGYVYTVAVRDGKSVSTIHNPGCVFVTGYQPEEYTKNPSLWIDMVPENDRPTVLETVEKVLHEPVPMSLQHRIIHKNGTIRWVSATLVPHTDQSGSIISYDGLITDITDREAAEAALRESEERFRQMAENVEEIFFLYQKEGNRLLYMSPVVARLYGVDPESIKADPRIIDRSVHPDDSAHVKFTDYETFYSMPIDEEFRIITPDGAVHWIRLRSFLVHNRAGEVERVAGLAADVTIRKLSAEKERLHNEQLQQADKMASLGILVSGVAHEVNNPNNFIMLNTPLLQDAWEQAKPILESHRELHGNFELGGIPFDEMKNIIPTLFQGIHDGSSRIKRIVEDLKNFARKDTSNYEATVDVCSVVREAVSLLASHIGKKTNKFTTALPGSPVLIKGNRQKLEQVIINLLHNACDALESKDGAVTITVKSYLSECIISVADEGKGIPRENMSHLTEPFFTTKRDIGGTGLGLSVSAGIVKEHNGKLLFESETGKGTTARIVLPAFHNEAETI